MLTENSLTNILTVAGISQIKWQRYTWTCSQTVLSSFVQQKNSINTAVSPGCFSEDPLISAYISLLDAGVPALWRYTIPLAAAAPPDPSKVIRELWVFWLFDPSGSHNDTLSSLQEIQSGFFNWDALVPSNGNSLTALRGSDSPTNTPLEYQLFINALLNVIERRMALNGAIRLGEAHILPAPICTSVDDMNSTKQPLSTQATSCTFKIHLSFTNLVFQPIIKRCQIRPLNMEDIAKLSSMENTNPPEKNSTNTNDINSKFSNNNDQHKREEIEVLIAPHGVTGVLHAPMEQSYDRHDTFQEWSLLTGVPMEILEEHAKANCHLPPVVSVKLQQSQKVGFCPTYFVFVNDTKHEHYSDFGIHFDSELQGISEDTSEKLRRYGWKENIAHPSFYSDKLNPLEEGNPDITRSILIEAAKSGDFPSVPTLFKFLIEHRTVNSSNNHLLWDYRNDCESIVHESLARCALQDEQIPPEELEAIQSKYRVVKENPNTESTRLNDGSTTVNDAHVKVENMFQPTSAPIAMDMAIGSSTATSGHFTTPGSLSTPDAANTDDMVVENGLSSDLNSFPGMLDMDPMMMDTMMMSSYGYSDLDNMMVTDDDFNFFDEPKLPTQSTGNNMMMSGEFGNLDMFNENPNGHSVPLINQNPSLDSNCDEKLSATPSLSIKEEPVLADSVMTPTLAYKTPVTEVVENALDSTPIPDTVVKKDPSESSEVFVVDEVSYESYDPHLPSEYSPIKGITFDVNKYREGGRFGFKPCHRVRMRRIVYTANSHPRIRRPGYLKTKKKVYKAKSGMNSMYNYKVGSGVRNPTDPRPLSVSDSSSESSNDSSSASEEESSEDEGAISSDDDGTTPVTHNQTVNSARYMILMDRFQPRANELLPVFNLMKSRQTEEMKLNLNWSLVFGVIEENEPRGQTTLVATPTEFRYALSDGLVLNKFQYLMAVERLCQQTTMGNYPFGGGIVDFTANGGEAIDGECTMLIAERYNYISRTLAKNPAKFNNSSEPLPDFALRAVPFLKKVLGGMFTYTNEMSQQEMLSLRGPLSVQQYLELCDVNQTQAKYGKYQVKKRKSQEPVLDSLTSPDIIVNHNEECIQASPLILRFWEKMNLEPYGGKKKVSWFAIYPEGQAMENSAQWFFTQLGAVYEASSLGGHTPGHLEGLRGGLIPAPFCTGPGNRRLSGYLAACQNLARSLKLNGPQDSPYIIVYLVNPFSEPSSYFELCHIYNELVAQCGGAPGLIDQLVLQIIPAEHILRASSFGGYQRFGLKEIAFSVYNRCRQYLSRPMNPASNPATVPKTRVYLPAYVLAKITPPTVHYSFKPIVNTRHTLMNPERDLHVAYSYSFDQKWMFSVWTDGQGGLLEQATYELTDRKSFATAARRLWQTTCGMISDNGMFWTVHIGRLGLMPHFELAEWKEITKNGPYLYLTVNCIDLDSPFKLFPDDDIIENTMEEAGEIPGNRPEILETSSGSTYALLWNHRTPLSSDSSLLPLASGSLIEVPPKSGSELREKQVFEPKAVEVHMLYYRAFPNIASMESEHTPSIINHLQATAILRNLLKQYHALSHLNYGSFWANCLPYHVFLVERLARILLTIQ
ncbi:mediator of RNA polymerase II transcription subunit 13 [Basidiobolus ranarum]|uniref:Mediator of RNA polymerase II transcription subunit 13 n=1 Tax=Basidiobolus ranarum TaxID=34480 RepID=A0ABR2W535_9FUNG